MRQACVVVCAALLLGAAKKEDAAMKQHRDEVDAWHRDRIERLTAEGGWLAVSGLFWLPEGVSTAGSDEKSTFRFPAGAPGTLGTFERKGAVVTFTPAADVTALVEGKPVKTVELRSDEAGKPTTVTTGSFTFFLIQRGEKLGIRLKDANAPARRGFKGIERFPVDPAWRIDARFEPFPQPKLVRIQTVIGTTEEMDCPGTVIFTVEGREQRLEPVVEKGESELFFIFADATSGKETYGAGRFLYTPLPKDGRVVVDFNKAYNPPCAFTKFATCPLPPPQNRLKVAIKAGEKAYH